MKIKVTILIIIILTGLSGTSFGFINLKHNKKDSTDTTKAEAKTEANSTSEICPAIPTEIVDIYSPNYILTDTFYKNRYKEKDLLHKVVDNWGNGFENLYGTRNVRPILHGVAYRGGANNYFHKENKRSNSNPLPLDGVTNLCKEGFSKSVYLYRQNFDTTQVEFTCDCINGEENTMEYYQKDYFDDEHIKDMLEMVYESAVNPTVGPVYLHCWNGWHASGFISAIILKQFCGYSDFDAVNYWDLATDGANRSPRYKNIRDKIKNFVPYPEYLISDSLGNYICPEMPEIIDSAKLHLTVEHLIIVPEAIPIGFKMVLESIQFKPYKTSLVNAEQNEELINLLKALEANPDLKIEIGGHTDKTGNETQNRNLSAQRAKSVYDFLISHDVNPNRLSYKGYGSSRPLMSNKYKSGRDANRRIEITILQKKEQPNDKLVDESTKSKPDFINPDKKYTLENINEAPLNTKILLENVKFSPYMYAITDTNKMDVDNLIKVLRKYPKMRIEIQGYTDNSGMNDINIEISNKRAEAVYKYLVGNGINKNRLSYKGYGPISPRYSNAYKWGRDLNRRIEVKVLSQ